MAKFYIHSAIPYVNAKPHIGHALEFVQTDVIARYHRLIGDDVLKLCGGDENALKNVQAAEKSGKPVQEFVDENNKFFEALVEKLETPYDIWQKGSDQQHHFPASQKLWKLCNANGDIYKKAYTGLYCVGCEVFYEREELNANGECFEHPGKKLEEVTEENYFFRLSKYEKQIIEIVESDLLTIIPDKRKNEILSFLKKGLQDISISRSNERAKNWGVPVPEDNTQRMYVWFDALNIYQSGVGFGSDEQSEGDRLRAERDRGGGKAINKEHLTYSDYQYWWPADVQVIGKGIIRFHAVYWIAFLLSAGLELPKLLFVHEYFTVNGQKMSKSLGNVIDPIEMIERYGADSLRYYVLRYFSPFSDGDFSEEKLKQAYNADLANGLGNLIARVAKLCENADYTNMGTVDHTTQHFVEDGPYTKALNEFRFPDALGFVWEKIAKLDRYINDEKPWELAKTDLERLNSVLAHCVDQIQEIGILLAPFMPDTSEKIINQFKESKIKSQKPLFPRI